MTCQNCAHEQEPSMAPAAPDAPDSAVGGPAGPTPGQRTRDFSNTWDTAPSVMGPTGAMNVGYVSNTESTEGQWARGDLPDMGYGYSFALARPRLMREPGTNLGTVNLANG